MLIAGKRHIKTEAREKILSTCMPIVLAFVAVMKSRSAAFVFGDVTVDPHQTTLVLSNEFSAATDLRLYMHSPYRWLACLPGWTVLDIRRASNVVNCN